VSKRKKKYGLVVKVDMAATPQDLRLTVVRLRALADRLMELAQQAEAAE
jgi:expansin (peptidoglycan-binding protein)